ncbi:hypothetical protein DFH09DRAFT_1222274 [Mycena vulgaris]|nr:hypothetical protein DFH09DRAFT_1222274 [Mycena vulgaris]
MTMTLTQTQFANSTFWLMQYTVEVTCHIPTLFTLTWNGRLSGGGNPAKNDLDIFTRGLEDCFGNLILSQLLFTVSEEPNAFGLTVQPCCDCGEVNAATSAELSTQASCRLRPARFSPVYSYVVYHGAPFQMQSDGLRLFSGDDPSSEALNTIFLNTFQSLYHLVRLELGLILENQIYASPEMYNLSIAPVYVPGLPFLNGSLGSTSDAEVMAKLRNTVRLFNDSDNVPVMGYLRSVPRLKPLGSAITSVFVSTFAMLSVLWTIFSVIAGALAGSHSDTREDPNDMPSMSQMASNSVDRKSATEVWDGSEASLFAPEKEDKASLRTLVERLSLTGDNNNLRMSIAMAEMQLTLARVCLSLRKHGIMAGSDDKNHKDLEDDLTDVQHQDSHPLLAQRSNRRASLDSLV